MIVKEDSRKFYKIQHRNPDTDWVFSYLNLVKLGLIEGTEHYGTEDIGEAIRAIEHAVNSMIFENILFRIVEVTQ